MGELASARWHGGGWVIASCPSVTLDLHAQLLKAALEINACGGTQEVGKSMVQTDPILLTSGMNSCCIDA